MKCIIIFVSILLISSCVNDTLNDEVVKEKIHDVEIDDHSCDDGCIHC